MSNFRFTRPDSFPPIVKNLIIINALVFLAQSIYPNLTNFLALHPIVPDTLRDILNHLMSKSEGIRNIVFQLELNDENSRFLPYQIATHMFAHGSITHILFNMFGLWMFGKVLENVWGPKRFFLFYILCGVGAAALHLIISYFQAEAVLDAARNGTQNPEALISALLPAVGASGAIMGIFIAFGYLFPNTELMLMFIPIPIKAKYMMIGMVLIDLFGGVANVRGDNIAHFAHLGGALTGFILVLIWNKRDRRRFY